MFFRHTIWSSIALCLAIALTLGCSDVSEYSTDEGECYRGSIVEADFVRSCFDGQTEMVLTFDVNDLSAGRAEAGSLSTSDGRFTATTLQQPCELRHDVLSLFRFPASQGENFITHTFDPLQATTLTVISLIEDGSVEARLMRAGFEPVECSEDAPAPDCTDAHSPLFGLFRLKRTDDCTL